MAELTSEEGTTPIEVIRSWDGKRGTYHAPKGWDRARIDAELGALKAERVKTWGEWAHDHLVPQTPTEWAIFGATAAPALLTGGGAVIPTLAAKQALKGAAETIGGSALRRIGTTMAAGGIGELFDPETSKEDPTKRFARGSLEGGVVGTGGELAAVPITYATKWWMDKWVRKGSAAGFGKQLAKMDEVFKNDGTAPDLFRVAFMNGTDEAAGQLYEKGINEVLAKSTGKYATIQSRALTRAVEKMGMKGILPSPGLLDDYPIASAFEILKEAGQFAFEAGKAKDTTNARALIRLREEILGDLKTHWKGSSIADDFAAVNHRYAVQKRGLELLRSNWQQVFPRGRADLDPAQLTDNLIEMMAEAGPTTRKTLGPHLNAIWQEFFRGRDPGARDLPGVAPAIRGGRVTPYGRPAVFGGLGAAPYRAGATEAIETVVPSTIDTLGGVLLRQKQLKELERKSLEERIFGPRPVGGVPG